MKLPEDKKERMQMFVLMGIVGAAIIAAVVMFGIKPMIKDKQDRKVKSAQLQTKIKNAQEFLDLTSGDGAKNFQTLSNTKAFADSHFLKPRLGGNYQLGVEEMVEGWSKKLAMQIPKPTQVGPSDIPHSDPARSVVKGYAFSPNPPASGVHDVIRFLRMIETDYPCMSVTRLSIVANPADPLKPTVSLILQTPIWSSYEDMTAKLAADLENSSKRKGRP